MPAVSKVMKNHESLISQVWVSLHSENPGLLYRLERGKDYSSVPKGIRDALVECGAPVNFMKELDARTRIFHSSF